MKRLLAVITLLCFIAPAFAATDFTGKWSGSFQITRPDGKLLDDKILLDLTQRDAVVTGTTGPNPESRHPIRNGKAIDDKLTFDLAMDGSVMFFTLALVDGRLKGESSAEFQGIKLKGVIDTTRVK